MVSLVSIIFNKFPLEDLEDLCADGLELDINDGEIVGFRQHENIPTEPASEQ